MGQTDYPSILLALHTTHLTSDSLPGRHIESLAYDLR